MKGPLLCVVCREAATQTGRESYFYSSYLCVKQREAA